MIHRHNMLIGNKIVKIITLILLTAAHVAWLLKAKSYVTPELIFPVWLLSNTRVFVSEINSFYPPALFYLVSSINTVTQNLFLSVNLIQITFVIAIDFILFYYLNKKINFKFALIGLAFYIPWQVFFRGNFLWFDLATIPFIAFSFFYFYDFVTKLKINSLIFSSAFLSLGFLFKNTILWIYVFYFVWIIYLAVVNKQTVKRLFRYLLILLFPFVLIGSTNFLIVSSKSTVEFAFYWDVLMKNFIYPRMSTSPRIISQNYYTPMALLIGIYLVSCIVIGKLSKQSHHQKYFLYTFPLVSLANIFPRWSDFHVQPFLFFLVIIFTYSLNLKSRLQETQRIFFNIFLLAVVISTILIIGNRIVTETKNKANAAPDYISQYAPNQLEKLIKNENIFVYDFPLYNGNPTPATYQPNSYNNLKLALKDPDEYYHVTNWQVALDYVKERNPEIVIVPHQIHDRMVLGIGLTEFEELISKNYHEEAEINKIYFIYRQEQD